MKKNLGSIINMIFGLVGYELRKKQNMNPSDLMSRMVKIRLSMAEVLDLIVDLGFSPTTVIDVGVAKGTPALYTHFPNAQYLLIEPLKEFENNLKEICKEYDAEYILAAAGAKSDMMVIRISPKLEGSSLLWTDGVKRTVPVITLDSVIKEKNLRGPYLLKVDVQGAELQVLDGASTLLKDTELVILEVSFFRFIDGYPEFYDVIDYMKKRGFVAFEVFGGHNRPLDGARAQVDIAFVREEGIFRKSHSWATYEQREEFYRS